MKTIKIKTETGWKEIEVSDESFKSIERESQPEFKVGGWYKWQGNIFRITKATENVFHTTYIDDPYTVRTYTYFHNPSDIYKQAVKAAPEEIKEHLIKEAEKRGFKEGVKYTSVGPTTFGHEVTLRQELNYISRRGFSDLLTDGRGGSVYHQGKWAEIVENDIIKVGRYEVQFVPPKADVEGKGYINVGCYHNISFDTVKKIYKQMKKLRK